MIGLDTNVLVRYFAQDDPKQTPVANRIMAGLSKDEPAFISLVTLCELVWVLEDAYQQKKLRILDVLRGLLESDEIEIENKSVAWAAFGTHRDAALDFSDAIIVESGKDAGCAHTVTFDKLAARTTGFLLAGR